MRVLICGSRGWNNKDYMTRVIQWLLDLGMTTLINGGANGADRMACEIAHDLGVNTITVPAKWTEYGRAAGIIRNGEMLKAKPDLVIAFFRGMTRGTRDMSDKATAAGIDTKICFDNGSKIEIMNSEDFNI